MKTKLWTGLALALLLALLCCGAASADDQGSCGESLAWKFESSTGTLSISGTGAMTNYNSYTQAPWYIYESAVQTITINAGVSSIGRNAFYYCTGLTSITIPRSVGNIGFLAFANCTSLTRVIILNPNAVIGDASHDVFLNCPEALTLYGWDDSTTEDYSYAANIYFNGWTASGKCGDNATWSLSEDARRLTISGTGATRDYGTDSPGFRAARIMVNSIIIEEGITRLGNYLFYEMDHVNSVSIPESIESIGQAAFLDCEKIGSTVIIPRNVESIGGWAFYNCAEIRTVRICNPSAMIDEYAFHGCAPGLTICSYTGSFVQAYADSYGINFEAWPVSGFCGHNAKWTFDPVEGKLSITGKGNMRDYDIAGTYNVPEWLSYRDQISSVVIGKGVTSVGKYAFFLCTRLTGVTIPASVTKISEGAFQLCSSLTGVKIPKGVTEIGKSAFLSCGGLKSVTFPNTLASIGVQAFVACSSLEDITLPISVTSIGDAAFANCGKLKSVKIYNVNTLIGTDAFYNAPSAMTLYGWPDSTAKIHASENGIKFKPLAVPDPDLFLPAGLTAINSEAFAGIKAKAPVIPEGVTTITGNPFAGSSVQVIYGYYASEADTFASSYGYYFIPIDDAWMAAH